MYTQGNFLAVQWLGLCASAAGGMGLIPGLGSTIPYTLWWGQKKKVYVNKIMYMQNIYYSGFFDNLKTFLLRLTKFTILTIF